MLNLSWLCNTDYVRTQNTHQMGEKTKQTKHEGNIATHEKREYLSKTIEIPA